MALSLEGLPPSNVGQLRDKYGDIRVPSLQQVVKEMMSEEGSAQARILIGEATGQYDIVETTKQMMTRLLTDVSYTECCEMYTHVTAYIFSRVYV